MKNIFAEINFGDIQKLSKNRFQKSHSSPTPLMKKAEIDLSGSCLSVIYRERLFRRGRRSFNVVSLDKQPKKSTLEALGICWVVDGSQRLTVNCN